MSYSALGWQFWQLCDFLQTVLPSTSRPRWQCHRHLHTIHVDAVLSGKSIGDQQHPPFSPQSRIRGAVAAAGESLCFCLCLCACMRLSLCLCLRKHCHAHTCTHTHTRTGMLGVLSAAHASLVHDRAMAVVEALESAAALRGFPLQQLSTQQILSCINSNSSFSGGCNGGVSVSAYLYVNNTARGLASEATLPYQASSAVGCVLHPQLAQPVTTLRLSIFNWTEIDQIVTAVQHAPVVVYVNSRMWYDYVGGIIQNNCNAYLGNADHSVVIVGYNLDSSPPYWIVRNSWGSNWGESGYCRVALGRNICGARTSVSASVSIFWYLLPLVPASVDFSLVSLSPGHCFFRFPSARSHSTFVIGIENMALLGTL
jgi:hypothetical protein